MARAKVAKKEQASVLGPGIHAGRIEMRIPVTTAPTHPTHAFRVRTVGGDVLPARLAEGFEEAFAEECMRERRTVMITAGEPGEVVILGALQTSRALSRDAHDTVKIEGKRVELDAEEGISIQVGKSTLRLDRHGVVKLVGQKMTMDVAAVVRVLSALVELP